MSRNNLFVIVAIVVALVCGVYGYLSSQPANLPMTERADSAADVTDNSASRAQNASSALPQSADYVKVGASPRSANGALSGIDVTLDIARGWHVNANPASMEFLIPTTLKVVQGKQPVEAVVNYPRGRLLKEGFDKPIAVYSDDTILSVTLHAPGAGHGPDNLQAIVNVQACNDMGRCLIPSKISSVVETEPAR